MNVNRIEQIAAHGKILSPQEKTKKKHETPWIWGNSVTRFGQSHPKKRHLRLTFWTNFKKNKHTTNKNKQFPDNHHSSINPVGHFLFMKKKRKPPESVGPATFKRTRSPSTTWIKPAIIPRIIGLDPQHQVIFIWWFNTWPNVKRSRDINLWKGRKPSRERIARHVQCSNFPTHSHRISWDKRNIYIYLVYLYIHPMIFHETNQPSM